MLRGVFFAEIPYDAMSLSSLLRGPSIPWPRWLVWLVVLGGSSLGTGLVWLALVWIGESLIRHLD